MKILEIERGGTRAWCVNRRMGSQSAPTRKASRVSERLVLCSFYESPCREGDENMCYQIMNVTS